MALGAQGRDEGAFGRRLDHDETDPRVEVLHRGLTIATCSAAKVSPDEVGVGPGPDGTSMDCGCPGASGGNEDVDG